MLWIRSSRQQKNGKFFSLPEINFKHENKLPRDWRDLGQILDCSLEIHTYLTNDVFLNIFFGKTGISTFFYIKFQNQDINNTTSSEVRRRLVNRRPTFCNNGSKNHKLHILQVVAEE